MIRTKKVLAFYFLWSATFFPFLAVFLRQDGLVFPCPTFSIMPIDVVLNLFRRQPHFPGQVCRRHRGVEPPDNWSVRSLAKPPLRLLIAYFAILHNVWEYNL